MSDVGKTKKRELFTLKISVQYVQQAIVVIKEEGGQYNTHRYNAIIFKRRRTGAEFFVQFSFFHWLVRAISLGGTDGGQTLFLSTSHKKFQKFAHIFSHLAKNWFCFVCLQHNVPRSTKTSPTLVIAFSSLCCLDVLINLFNSDNKPLGFCVSSLIMLIVLKQLAS